MNRFHNDCILAEKKMNTVPNADKTLKNPPPAPTTTTTTPKRAPLTKAYSCSDASSDNYGFITPREFVELVSQNPSAQDLPILDCRSQMDFGCERIRSSHNINCRTKIMARKLTSKRLEDVEPNLSSSLNKSDTVILYDQSTDVQGDNKFSSLPINLVVQAAQKSNKKVQIIQGGLDAVKTEYPHLIECPKEDFKDKLDSDLPPPPPSPDTIDKENVVMTEILPHIFVGNTSDAQDLGRLTKNGITHVLNCTPDLPFLLENKYKCMRIDVLDLPSQNIRKHFDQAIEFIDSALRSKGNILVHCSAGISRSPTLVLAYMMKKNHWTLEEAFDKMRKLRQIVDPNVSFIVQLKEWEKYVMSTTVTNEINDDNSGTTNTSRAASNSYCGSTSKNKTDNKSHTDSVIIVN
jgi:protein-tyrosine phosphatase